MPDADAMMIIARRTRTDPCFPRRTICSSDLGTAIDLTEALVRGYTTA